MRGAILSHLIPGCPPAEDPEGDDSPGGTDVALRHVRQELPAEPRDRGGHPPALDRTTATITKVVDNPLGSDSDCIALIRLDDGREGRIVVPRYAAVDGGRVPLVVERYEDGDTYLAFDVDRWVDSAAGP